MTNSSAYIRLCYCDSKFTASTKGISASCIDKLPDRYISICPKSCQVLANNGLCNLNWNTIHGGMITEVNHERKCASRATGLVKDTCKISCNTCGNNFYRIYSII